jgi:hypothetical protein
MQPPPLPPMNTRLGFHYFPDTLHYRENDLTTWLPELRSLGASWLTLLAPARRAIPEFFLNGLIKSGIEPVLHFPLPLEINALTDTLDLLFSAYARWGVHYVSLFDQPNSRSSWSQTAWAQADLVERFLDIFLPVAESALREGLIPVFPPLAPGGDYWDTAFLRAALRGILRRGKSQLFDSLGLAAYSIAGERPLNWGVGGPERWPAARPYFTPPSEQDQRGFRIFDWYLTLAQAEMGRKPPILLLRAGSFDSKNSRVLFSETAPMDHTHRNLAIVALVSGETAGLGFSSNLQDELKEPIPPEVLACNFWLLSSSSDSPFVSQAWFQPDGTVLPIVGELRRWIAGVRAVADLGGAGSTMHGSDNNQGLAISHYLLMPIYGWGIPEWHLDAVRPFIKEFHPTIGFSLEEASHARRVTVVGGIQAYSDQDLQPLHQAGCSVERITSDGTVVATE